MVGPPDLILGVGQYVDSEVHFEDLNMGHFFQKSNEYYEATQLFQNLL